MIPFSWAVSSRPIWSKIPHTRNCELKLNDEIMATLVRPSCWSSKFLADTRDGHWIFRRGGFLGTGAEIASADSAEPIATFKYNWSAGGTLIFADGQTFHLRCKGWWRQVWIVTTEDGQLVLQLHAREKTVELWTSAAVPSLRLSLLTIFTWYRVRQAEEDAATVAVAVISAS